MSGQPDHASRRSLLAALGAATVTGPMMMAGASRAQARKPLRMLNVSYDPTRELYKDSTPPTKTTGRVVPARW